MFDQGEGTGGRGRARAPGPLGVDEAGARRARAALPHDHVLALRRHRLGRSVGPRAGLRQLPRPARCGARSRSVSTPVTLVRRLVRWLRRAALCGRAPGARHVAGARRRRRRPGGSRTPQQARWIARPWLSAPAFVATAPMRVWPEVRADVPDTGRRACGFFARQGAAHGQRADDPVADGRARPARSGSWTSRPTARASRCRRSSSPARNRSTASSRSRVTRRFCDADPTAPSPRVLEAHRPSSAS